MESKSEEQIRRVFREELSKLLAEVNRRPVPQLFKLPDAARRLAMGLTALKAAIARGEVRTVSAPGTTHKRISSEEIERICSETAPAQRVARSGPRPRFRSVRQTLDAELAKLDAVAKARRKRR